MPSFLARNQAGRLLEEVSYRYIALLNRTQDISRFFKAAPGIFLEEALTLFIWFLLVRRFMSFCF